MKELDTITDEIEELITQSDLLRKEIKTIEVMDGDTPNPKHVAKTIEKNRLLSEINDKFNTVLALTEKMKDGNNIEELEKEIFILANRIKYNWDKESNLFKALPEVAKINKKLLTIQINHITKPTKKNSTIKN